MNRRTICFTILMFNYCTIYAQGFDTIRYRKSVDSIVNLIDAKNDLIEFISEGQVINRRTKKLINDGYAEHFYHENVSHLLMKVFYNPTKDEKFTSTYYVSNDSLIFVRINSRKPNNNLVENYYCFNGEIFRNSNRKTYIDSKYFIKQWTRLYNEHKKDCP